MKLHVTLMLILITITGCSTQQETRLQSGSFSKATAASASEIKNNRFPASSDDDNDKAQKEIETSLRETLSFCQPRLSGFEQKSADQAKKAYWLSMTGLVAGSVFAPALASANAGANASWISALSGWSGATNFAGQSLKTSGLSGASIAETRNTIIKNIKEQMVIAADTSKTNDERKSAIMKIHAECIVYEVAVPNILEQ